MESVPINQAILVVLGGALAMTAEAHGGLKLFASRPDLSAVPSSSNTEQSVQLHASVGIPSTLRHTLIADKSAKLSVKVSVKPARAATPGSVQISWSARNAPPRAAVALFISARSDAGVFTGYISRIIAGDLPVNGTHQVHLTTGPRPLGAPERSICPECWPRLSAVSLTSGTYRIYAKLYVAPSSPAKITALPQSAAVIATGESASFDVR